MPDDERRYVKQKTIWRYKLMDLVYEVEATDNPKLLEIDEILNGD